MNARRPKSAFSAGLMLAAVTCIECRAQRPGLSLPTETTAECGERKRQLVEFVAALPARAVADPSRVKLPLSTLGGVPGTGSVLEITAEGAALDGTTLGDRGNLEARVRALRERMAGSAHRVLYVAAAADIEVKTLRAYFGEVPESVELRLLVRLPPGGAASPGEGTEAARQLAAKVLLEPDPLERRAIADQGYRDFAECPALEGGVSSLQQLDRERWPALKAALGEALPKCDCNQLDTSSLRLLIAAEQRAGAAALAWVPASFLRDDRCDASMPLRSVKKLVSQMEAFDAEFAGVWQKDALQFDDVVVSDRLGVQFCDALPGETLAAKQRARATLYFRVAGNEGCDAFRFEPIAAGSPLGTWRRVTPSRPPLAFHYSQAAEEIRLFGPVDPASASTPGESREWPCDETLRLTGVDKESIRLDDSRWFFDKDACERSTGAPMRGGCVAANLAGAAAKPAKPDQ